MVTAVRISVGKTSLRAELFDSPCARKIVDILPIETTPNRWGDEFYFAIPVIAPLDDTATTKVKIGDMGYWPPGRALAIFFGPTPMSAGNDPVPASEVNLVGRVVDDATSLRQEKGALKLRIEVVNP